MEIQHKRSVQNFTTRRTRVGAGENWAVGVGAGVAEGVGAFVGRRVGALVGVRVGAAGEKAQNFGEQSHDKKPK